MLTGTPAFRSLFRLPSPMPVSSGHSSPSYAPAPLTASSSNAREAAVRTKTDGRDQRVSPVEGAGVGHRGDCAADRGGGCTAVGTTYLGGHGECAGGKEGRGESSGPLLEELRGTADREGGDAHKGRQWTRSSGGPPCATSSDGFPLPPPFVSARHASPPPPLVKAPPPMSWPRSPRCAHAPSPTAGQQRA